MTDRDWAGPSTRRRSRSTRDRDRYGGRERYEERDRGRYEDEGRRRRSPPHREPDRRRSPRELDRRRSPGDLDRRRSPRDLDRRRSRSPLSRARSLERDHPDPSDAEPDPNAGKPDFTASGKLAAETNLYKGVVLKYHEPAEARKPARGWRVYVFKGKEEVDLWHLHRQSAFLVGRDRVVADIPVDHPSTSKQHAVVQFRQVTERNEFGDSKSLVKPFIIDLDSANGTSVNDEKVPPSRFYELKSGDVIKFAFSTREYVLLAET